MNIIEYVTHTRSRSIFLNILHISPGHDQYFWIVQNIKHHTSPGHHHFFSHKISSHEPEFRTPTIFWEIKRVCSSDNKTKTQVRFYRFILSMRWNLSIVSALGDMNQMISEYGVVKASFSFKLIPSQPWAVVSASKWCDQRKWHLNLFGDRPSPELML